MNARDRFAKAAREAFSFREDRVSANVHLMDSYEGKGREKFSKIVEGIVYEEKGEEGFFRRLLEEYDRFNGRREG